MTMTDGHRRSTPFTARSIKVPALDSRFRRLLVGLATASLTLFVDPAARANVQPSTPPAAEPTEKPAEKPTEKTGDKPADPPPAPSPDGSDKASDAPPASLDELLGLEDQDAPADPSSGVDPSNGDARSELDRKLADEKPSDDFETAVDLMSRAAANLEKANDAGLATQRLQEDALRRLDKLIDDAKKRRQQRKPQPKPQQNQQQNQQQQQQQQQQDSRESERQNQQNQGETSTAPRRDGALSQVAPGGSAAWGSLPEHVRDSLMQGFSDRFSSLYQRMTESYYRRLAEDPARRSSTPPANQTAPDNTPALPPPPPAGGSR